MKRSREAPASSPAQVSTPKRNRDVPVMGKVKDEVDKNGIRVKTEIKIEGGGTPSGLNLKCPYLDTIHRYLLDFDLEKQCSISLKKQNVYMCLVCGMLFQGRGKNTHAYTHSVQARHHVYIHTKTERFYCLPDNYEIIDSSLADIQRALNPRYTKQLVTELDSNNMLSKNVQGVAYLPGFVGMNNLKRTDFINTVVHSLAHVQPLRDYFLRPQNYAFCKSKLVLRFGELIRKLWSCHSFKNCTASHEFVNEVTVLSKKRFRVGQQSLVIEFLAWLLANLHKGLGGNKGAKSSIIHRTFRGTVRVKTQPLIVKRKGSSGDSAVEAMAEDETVQTTPFLYLSLDLPAMPLFKDTEGGNIIPQEPLPNVLEKFGGHKPTDFLFKKVRKFYQLAKLPPYLIICLKRFTKNNFFVEKNSTVINFPIKNLELKDYLLEHKQPLLPTPDELRRMSVGMLKKILISQKMKHKDISEKAELVRRAEICVRNVANRFASKYNLVANIVHDSPAERGKERAADPVSEGSYHVDVFHKESDQWYDIEDLHVKEIMPQLIGISESNLLIYERQKS